MQPQTMNAPTTAQKIQSCIHCIVVFSGRLTPLRAIKGHSAYQVFRNSPSSLVIFDAIRLVSSFVSSLAADRRPEPLRARRLRLRPTAFSEVRIPLLARHHDLRIDLRQGGGLPLGRP